MIRIRDPIHGSIRLSPGELMVVDDPVFQRLRAIKQLGFAENAFPGATHNRFSHGLGAMELAGQMFDRLLPEEAGLVPDADRRRLRQIARLALLLHDIGHPPASHASEMAMPLRAALGLACHRPDEHAPQATHEDYTVKLLVDSSVGATISQAFGDDGIDGATIAHLINGRFPDEADKFVVAGIDFCPMLSQLVSGDMDADRMDYLQRDSYFAGVSYGKFDQPWLLENLRVHVADNRAHVALTHRALFAFEDFLLSRYHMFLSVYLHRIPVGYESMLARYYAECPDEFPIPSDPEAYLHVDDIALWSALRASSNPWAQRIVRREGFSVALETNTAEAGFDLTLMRAALTEAGIEHFVSRTSGMLRKPIGVGALPLFVVNRGLGTVQRMDEYSRIFERYAQPAPLLRIYVPPEQKLAARALVRSIGAPALADESELTL